MRRECRKKLTPTELKAAGVTRDLVTRRVRTADRGEQTRRAKAAERKYSRRSDLNEIAVELDYIEELPEFDPDDVEAKFDSIAAAAPSREELLNTII
ncbi:MAG TPA: hypothetical protein VNA27_14445 [Rubrobacteraceae bacterium]|nr:hypothetical protein [Rubrobacteraceae bacterium]